ncbi:hypothetical protein RSW32_26290, partial [Escherichia coli]|uniref:hypothetical protein n=1 Tax=Escherichia coli TaxID=562 RepID=UPI0028DEBC95
LLAGTGFGLKSDVRTHSPMFYAHWDMHPGAKAELPIEYRERAAYVAAGTVEADGRSFRAGQMLIFAPKAPAVVTASG